MIWEVLVCTSVSLLACLLACLRLAVWRKQLHTWPAYPAFRKPVPPSSTIGASDDMTVSVESLFVCRVYSSRQPNNSASRAWRGDDAVPLREQGCAPPRLALNEVQNFAHVRTSASM